jgi:hypothetical protein
VTDPSGQIIQTNVPSGVFGHFLDWTSLDWLGNSVFSQGGGFFPVKNKDDTSTVLYVPINQTGTYTILTHSTLFGGESTTEPITLAAKFTNISPEMNIDVKEEKAEVESIPNTPSENSETTHDAKTSDSAINSISNYAVNNVDSSFNVGIIIGLIIGVAIGLTCIFIIRQKPPN